MAAPPPFLLTPLLLLLALSLTSAAAFVHPGDLEVLEDLRRSIKNPEALGWANGADPCASPRVSCDRSGRVRNLDLSCANLSGALPASFSNLQALQSLKLQGNSLSGPLPSFRGMAALRHAYLSGNSFDTIPSDFFEGLRHLEVISLANNFLLNASAGGWAIPPGLATSAPQLRALRLHNSGLVGELPESLGAMAGLQQLSLSYNHLSGPLPASFRGSRIQILTLSYQRMSGSLAVLAGMASLSNALLDGNQFAGTIPEDIDACQNLTRLWLNRNVLVGLLPQALAALPKLNDIRLDNNYLLGPVPALKAPNATFFHTGICGAVCAPEVMYLLKFLGNVGYPQKLASSWSGNDPCSNWPGVVCYEGRVSQLNLPGYGLNGSISSSLGNLTMLSAIRLNGNNLTGQVPSSLMELRLLKKLDVSKNNLAGPLPAFRLDVNVDVTGNPNLSAHPSNSHENRTGRIVVVLCVTIPIALVLMALISLAVVKLCCKKKGPSKPQPQTNAIAVHPQDSPTRQSFMLSLQVLRVATNNFSEENVLGRGGFGIVYKGVLHDGTIIAVKRMLSTVISNEPIDQFQAEIAILKVRHRHLVSILGYSVEDNERLLVYEHMPNGSLSKHLFRWKLLGLEPLSWKKRLSIALDVARGMEYLHSLAQHCFIHRDLKPANILLGDDFRAKVADFGLLRPAPDRNASVKTNVAGTWGYLAPEYVETGKVTTKADIFSFGVMLMELITGLTAIDEKRVEETYYLPSWFRQILKDEEKLRAAIDPALVVTDELESVSAIAELAGHCTAQEPSQRPDMGYVVTALSPMVEKWKPSSPSSSEAEDIDLHPPLLQTVKDWQESDARMSDGGVLSLQDVSADGR